MPKELLIIGSGTGWELAPHDVEAWCVHRLIGKRPIARIFEVHWLRDADDDQRASRKKAHEMDLLYYTTENYPIIKITKFFDTEFFTNSFCYAMALAIYEGYEKVDLYGVIQTEAYLPEKNGVDYWCGQMMGRGIDLTVHGFTKVMKTHNSVMYGYGGK